MTKHTNGPWEARRGAGVLGLEGTPWQVVALENGEAYYIAKVDAVEVARDPLRYRYAEEVNAANARVMAATPKLLEAALFAIDTLEEAIEHLQATGYSVYEAYEARGRLQDAIKKARGEDTLS
jgi:hypothetical protein